MKSLRVRDYMSKIPVVFNKEMSIPRAVEKFLHAFQTGGPVVDDKRRVIGYIAELDCIKEMLESSYTGDDSHTVGAIMQTDVICVAPDKSIIGLAELMQSQNAEIYPVVNEHQILIGVISQRDVLKALAVYWHEAVTNEADH